MQNQTSQTIKRTLNDVKFLNKVFSKYGLKVGAGRGETQDHRNQPVFTKSFEKTKFEAFDEQFLN